jgi:glycosyltransferase involved in cell wall biosynthesis
MLLENCFYPRDPRVRREARALVAAGHQVTVIAPRDRGQSASETLDGVRVRRFRLPAVGTGALTTALEYGFALPALHYWGARELFRGATVLHLHNPPDLLFGIGAVARLLGAAVVYDQHDLFPELLEQKLGPGLPMRLGYLSERATYAVATTVLAANQSHARMARDRGRVGPAQVRVVRNGPPLKTVVARPELRSGVLSDPELVYVGLLASQDGADVLAELLGRLHRDHGLTGARLVVVGEGEERAKLERRLAVEGVSRAATITGWVSPEEVRARLAAADICVDPSPPTALNEHSTMIKIGEYLASGKPVVAYDLLETARTAAGAARLVPPGDLAAMAAAIAELAATPDDRQALAEAGLRRAPEISWERSVEQLLDAYQSP